MNGSNGSNGNRILWWLIALLTSLTAGAGSSWITRLDGMAQLKAEVEVLKKEVHDVLDEFRHHQPNRKP